jgi:hypothetical protein
MFLESQKENEMPNYNTESLSELAQPIVNPTPETVEDRGPTCQPGDKECIQRWIAAFSDCD